MDTFAFHPPNLSPLPPHLASADDPAAGFARLGSSSGAGPSSGFTQTLPPLQEHVSTESVPGVHTATAAASGTGRPTLVGFEQLTGEDPQVGDAPADANGQALGSFGGESGATGHAVLGGFRDPFARPSSSSHRDHLGQPQQQVRPDLHASGAPPPHAHSFFHPHPNVNTRNTRPMTAPSGPAYFHGPSYSAAPSAFYSPSLQTSGDAASTYDALHLAPAAPPSLVPPSSASIFQYAVDTSPSSEYDAFRERGFSLPDVAGLGAGSAGDPAGADGTSPTSSGTPFFYTPPSVVTASSLRGPQPVPPATAPEGYYPAALDPAQALMPAPLSASTSAVLPPSSDLSLSQQRPQTGPEPSRRGSTGGSISGGGNKQYNFVQQAGQTSKRPRRRYDEIERMYNCDYPGCTKAYGTLNHLNSHKTMQKHGPKSTPAQFKEMRKAWRERKKAEAAAAARSRAAQPPPQIPPPTAAPSASTGGLPHVLALPPHLNERPRPSTSAGEYHFSMPAPFMTPLGAPMLAYPPVPMMAPQPLSAAPVQHAMASSVFDMPSAAATYEGDFGGVGPYGPQDMYSGAAGSGELGGGGSSGTALRPVTAPSYYVAPQFGNPGGLGSHPLAPATSTAGSYVPHRLVSGLAGHGADRDRRFSLPSATLAHGSPLHASYPPPPPSQQQQQHQPTTTLEMPRPVHAGPNGYSALIHGGVTAAQAASSMGVERGSLGRAGAAGGGAAQEDAGSFEEIAAR